MAFSQGSQSRISYITEVTAGTTPATPTMSVVPVQNFGVNYTTDILQDPSLQSDRMRRYQRNGNKHVAGDIDFTLLGQIATTGNMIFDPWLESVMLGTWTTNVLKNGSTPKSFTIEHFQSDITQYRLFTGCQMNKLQLSIGLNQVVTAKASFIGMGHTISSSPTSGATYTATPTAPTPMWHGTGTFAEGGSTSNIITGLNFTIDNGMDPNFALGSPTAASITAGMVTVNGTVTVYYQDAVMINKFINETASSLSVTLTDGTRSLVFLLPNVKYNGANMTVTDASGIVTLPFTALYGSSDATVLKITRS